MPTLSTPAALTLARPPSCADTLPIPAMSVRLRAQAIAPMSLRTEKRYMVQLSLVLPELSGLASFQGSVEAIGRLPRLLRSASNLLFCTSMGLNDIELSWVG